MLGGTPVVTAVRFYLEHRPRINDTLTLAAALASFRKKYDTPGRRPRRPKYLAELDRNLDRMKDALGERKLAAITDVDLEELLTTVSGRYAVWDLWKFAQMFFRWARSKRLLIENPCDFVDAPDAPTPSNGILSLWQTQRFLDTTVERFPELMPAVSLQLFGGIRTEEIEHLDWGQIRLGETIRVERAKLHARPRTIDFWPANLTTLLQDHRPKSGRGPVSPGSYLERKGDLIKAAAVGFKHPQNAFRHNYASYGCALFQSGDRIAVQLGHRNARLLWQTYRDWVDRDSASAYFHLVPRTCLNEFAGACCAHAPPNGKP